MKVCYVLLHYDGTFEEPERFFEHAPLMRHFPKEMVTRGHEVDVVAFFPTSHRFSEGEVRYHFVPPGPLARSTVGRVARTVNRSESSLTPAYAATNEVRATDPDLIHFHGTNLYLNHYLLLRQLGRRRPSFVVHHHGGQPSPSIVARTVQRYNLHRADRVLFTTNDHARPFIDAGLVAEHKQVVEFVETSSPLQRKDRERARHETGMRGDPVVLWVGRLDSNKDPLTALRGFDRVLEACPSAHFYLHYLTDELLPDLRDYVGERSTLSDHVHFGGRVSTKQMESIFNSADFLIQASHHEHSGYAVLEAMACGVIPVVTDIPSFRAMTSDGRHGLLFPICDANALARAVISTTRDKIPLLSNQIHDHFRSKLSFSALAQQLDSLYGELLDEKSRKSFRT